MPEAERYGKILRDAGVGANERSEPMASMRAMVLERPCSPLIARERALRGTG